MVDLDSDAKFVKIMEIKLEFPNNLYTIANT